MKLGLLSNSLLNPYVSWTTLQPPLFTALEQQPNVRTISPPPLAWEWRREWAEVRSKAKGCDLLFWIQHSARPHKAIHAASYLNFRARRSCYVLDAWKSSLTKIGLVATVERLSPCFVAYREATDELRRRFPASEIRVAAFWRRHRHLSPPQGGKVDLCLLDGTPPRAVTSGAPGLLRGARPTLRLFQRRPIELPRSSAG